MDTEKRSRTSEHVAIRRAIHQLVDHDPRILVDPIALRIVDQNSEAYRRECSTRNDPLALILRSGQVLRSRYAEDCLADATRRGVTQYLILGAGLDTLAYRQPGWAQALRIFEVDHPATQSWKKERLAMAQIVAPANLTFVSIDFETTPLSNGLRACGFNSGVLTFCSWLGVTMYLTEDAIDRTLIFASHLPTGSEIVFDYILPPEALPSEEAAHVQTVQVRTAVLGEPQVSLFLPEQLEAKLHRIGFSEVVHLTPEQAHERYFRERHDGLASPRAARLVRAIV